MSTTPKRIDAILAQGALTDYHLAHAARADLCRRLGRTLTGYLGGAVASHVRVGSGLFPVFFALMLGGLIWVGLFLRDERLRALLPL